MQDDLYFMTLAYDWARKAVQADEVPIGAVVVYGGTVIAGAHNRVEALKDPTAHAELLVIREAAAQRGDWRLSGCTLYVTKEPCPMCSGAALMARFDKVVYACLDPKMGCLGGATDLNTLAQINHHLIIVGGVMAEECHALLRNFFLKKR